LIALEEHQTYLIIAINDWLGAWHQEGRKEGWKVNHTGTHWATDRQWKARTASCFRTDWRESRQERATQLCCDERTAVYLDFEEPTWIVPGCVWIYGQHSDLWSAFVAAPDCQLAFFVVVCNRVQMCHASSITCENAAGSLLDMQTGIKLS
jgi:hypothetical protein